MRKVGERVARLGGNVSYIVMDEPSWFGHTFSGPKACRADVVDIARNATINLAAVKKIFPQLKVGDGEPIRPSLNDSTIAQWADAFCASTGNGLAFPKPMSYGAASAKSRSKSGLRDGVIGRTHSATRPQTISGLRRRRRTGPPLKQTSRFVPISSCFSLGPHTRPIYCQTRISERSLIFSAISYVSVATAVRNKMCLFERLPQRGVWTRCDHLLIGKRGHSWNLKTNSLL
jgi:hypothetical protein